MNAMQWDDVRYFLALAREGSLSAAARILRVEHSTVARRAESLERCLKLKLFDRLPRGWVLTAEGQSLLGHACELEDRMLALQRAALGAPVLAGRVRLSAPPLLLSQFLVPRLSECRIRYPGIDLELAGERRMADLERGETDIALRLAEPRSPDLVVRTLGQMNYGLYGTAACLAVSTADQVFIGFDDSMPDLPQKRWFDAAVQNRRVVLRTNDLAAMCRAAAEGWGIAMLPVFMARQVPELRLAEQSMEPPPPWPIHLVMHSDVRLAPRVRAIADVVIELFQQHAMEL